MAEEELALEDLEQEAQATESVSDVEPTPDEIEATAPQKTVPLAALQEERARVKEMRERMQALEAQSASTEQFKQEFLAYKNQIRQQQQMPQIPKFEDDPLGHLRQKQQYQEQFMAAVAQTEQQRAIQQQAEAQQRALAEHVSMREAQFVARQPDYLDAVNYLKALKAKEAEVAGVNDPVAINQHIQGLAQQFAATAIQRGIDPAEAAYNLAKQYGYKPKGATDDFDTIAQGQQAAKTISRGGQVETPSAVKSLLDAEGEEFDKMWAKVFGSKKRV